MDNFLNVMEAVTECLLTTPFAIPLAVCLFVGGCWVLAEALSKAQEVAR